MPKKITIDTLARMTQDEFVRIDEKFEGRFDKVDEDLGQMKQQLNQMHGTLKTVLDVVLDIPPKKAFNRLENKMDTFDARLTSVERKVK